MSIAFKYTGAIDASVVQNVSYIAWSEVVPFRPFSGSAEAEAGNASSYLQWAIEMGDILVSIYHRSLCFSYSMWRVSLCGVGIPSLTNVCDGIGTNECVQVGSTAITPQPTYEQANSNTSIALFDV